MNLQKKNSNPSVVINMNTHFTCSIGMLILFSSAWFSLYLFVIYKANIEVYGILFPIVDLSYAKTSHNENYSQKLRTMKVWPIFIIPPLPEGGGGYTVLPLSVCPSVLPSFRPSKIFFVAFFSVTVDGRNLIFGHKHHIGIPYCG